MNLAGLIILLIVGAVMIWHVEARRRTAAAARANGVLLRTALDAVDHGVALLDADCRLVAWNGQLCVLLGLELQVGTAIKAIITEVPGWSDEPPEIAAAQSRTPLRLEREVGLTGRCFEVRGSPGPGGMYALTYTDISERRAQERIKNDFISNVSHELRTPLTSIRGATGLLMGPLKGELTERALHLANVADRNALRLLTLVNDLLDADKMESGKLDFAFEPIDLNEVALEAAEMNRAYAARREVTLALGRENHPVIVNADPARLQQVMANLISNAAKFSPIGGVVVITVEAFAQEAAVTVQDCGEGIPEEFRSRIFGKFAQAATGNQRQTGGSGLGLNISRAIVERHGGAIGFESVPGNTRFRFSLPLMEAQAKAA
jgi:signal transduction histidine kinase